MKGGKEGREPGARLKNSPLFAIGFQQRIACDRASKIEGKEGEERRGEGGKSKGRKKKREGRVVHRLYCV